MAVFSLDFLHNQPNSCPLFSAQGRVQEKRGYPFHDQRQRLLRIGPHIERGSCRGDLERLDQGLQDQQMGDHVEELGSKLAEPELPQRPEPLIPGPGQQRSDRYSP